VENVNVKKVLFVVLFLALFLLVARLFYPFLTVLLWSGLLYVLLVPLYDRVTTRVNPKTGKPFWGRFWAGLFATGGVLLIMVPLCILVVNLLKQVGELGRSAVNFLETNPDFFDLSPRGTLGAFIARLTNGQLDLSSFDLKGALSNFVAESGRKALGFSGTILRKTASFALSIVFMVFTLYFFFVDGKQLAKILVGAIPIEREYTRLFMRTLRDTSKQLVSGYLLVALYQAAAAFILFSLFGVKGPLVLAVLTGVASFIPMAGAGLIWLPVSVIHMATGDLMGGVALLALSAIFISTLDNFIRPAVLTGRLNIHPLLIFFSILGGLTVFGFNGIVLGPLILILFFTALGLYDKIYRSSDLEADRKEEASKNN
jgi:predicted PurR-regulated permease PerM